MNYEQSYTGGIRPVFGCRSLLQGLDSIDLVNSPESQTRFYGSVEGWARSLIRLYRHYWAKRAGPPPVACAQLKGS